MLVELRAENYAVIDHAIAVFGPGLNLLTGETGAGKSILVDALALLMGGKASAEVVRHGADKAVVACVFESTPGAEAILEENGIDAEGNEIILRREILATGKGRVFVNNQPATVAVLKQLAPNWRWSTRRPRLSPASTRRSSAFCSTASPASPPMRSEAYTAGAQPSKSSTSWSKASRTACAWSTCGAISARKSKRRVSNPAKTKAWKPKSASWPTPKSSTPPPWAHSSSSTRAASAEVALRAALRNVEELARYDAVRRAAQQLESARAIVGDVSASLRDYAEGIDASPERLAEIEDRLARSTASSANTARPSREVIAFGEEVARKLAEVEDKRRNPEAVKRRI
jgi:DNA repair protein RecN (Recombination protein N)